PRGRAVRGGVGEAIRRARPARRAVGGATALLPARRPREARADGAVSGGDDVSRAIRAPRTAAGPEEAQRMSSRAFCSAMNSSTAAFTGRFQYTLRAAISRSAVTAG